MKTTLSLIATILAAACDNVSVTSVYAGDGGSDLPTTDSTGGAAAQSSVLAATVTVVATGGAASIDDCPTGQVFVAVSRRCEPAPLGDAGHQCQVGLFWDDARDGCVTMSNPTGPDGETCPSGATFNVVSRVCEAVSK